MDLRRRTATIATSFIACFAPPIMGPKDLAQKPEFVNVKTRRQNEHRWNRWNASHLSRRQVCLRPARQRGMPEQEEERNPEEARCLRHLPEHQTAGQVIGQERDLVAPAKTMNIPIFISVGLLSIAFSVICYLFFLVLVWHEQVRLINSKWKYGAYKARTKNLCFICESKGYNNSYILLGSHPITLCRRCASEHGPDYVRYIV